MSLLSKDSLTLEEANIRWQTYDGRKPVDDDLGCGMFSLLASQLGLGCQVVFIMYIVLTMLLKCRLSMSIVYSPCINLNL